MERKGTTTEAQRRAMAKYQKKFVHTGINFEREFRDKVSAYCDRHGTSLGRLVTEYLEKLLAEEEL